MKHWCLEVAATQCSQLPEEGERVVPLAVTSQWMVCQQQFLVHELLPPSMGSFCQRCGANHSLANIVWVRHSVHFVVVGCLSVADGH